MKENLLTIKKLALSALICTFITSCQKSSTEDTFNEVMAKELGADQFGMKSYIECLLKPGEMTIISEEKANNIAAERQILFKRLIENNQLVMVGYYVESDKRRLQLILNVRTKQEAREIMSVDPYVKTKIQVTEFDSWYGPAAIEKLRPIHNQIAQIKP